MVSIANQTLSKYIENLDENSRKEIFHVIASNNVDLETEFNTLKESAMNKLQLLSEKEGDEELKGKISETIGKIGNEKYSQISYVKLKNLEKSILLDS
jgi:hypothetical protein